MSLLFSGSVEPGSLTVVVLGMGGSAQPAVSILQLSPGANPSILTAQIVPTTLPAGPVDSMQLAALQPQQSAIEWGVGAAHARSLSAAGLLAADGAGSSWRLLRAPGTLEDVPAGVSGPLPQAAATIRPLPQSEIQAQRDARMQDELPAAPDVAQSAGSGAAHSDEEAFSTLQAATMGSLPVTTMAQKLIAAGALRGGGASNVIARCAMM